MAEDDILYTTDPNHEEVSNVELFSPEETEHRGDPMEMDTNPTSTGDKLLSLRKEYKKTAVSLVKAKAHQDFITACKNNHQTPKGLRVNVKCSALLADLSDVKEKFIQTTNQAQNSYVDHLETHYDTVVDQLKQKEDLLKSTMETLKTQATAEELETHAGMMKKTTDNIHSLYSNLQKKKKRKLETITQPRQKRRKVEKSNQTKTKPPQTMVSKPNINKVSNPNIPPLFPPAQSSSNPIQPIPAAQPPMQPISAAHPPIQPIPPPLQAPQSLLNLTLADLFTRLQMTPTQPQPPRIIYPQNCTLGNGQPPQLVNPSGKDGLGQPPQLSRSIQQHTGPQTMPPHHHTFAYCTPGRCQPPQLVTPDGRMGTGQPPQLSLPFQQQAFQQ